MFAAEIPDLSVLFARDCRLRIHRHPANRVDRLVRARCVFQNRQFGDVHGGSNVIQNEVDFPLKRGKTTSSLHRLNDSQAATPIQTTGWTAYAT